MSQRYIAERITNVKKERIEDDRRPPVGIRGLVAAPRLCGTIYKHYDFKTLVLVASARHPQHVVEAGLTGGHICTMPFSIFQLVKHPLTDLGVKRFLVD